MTRQVKVLQQRYTYLLDIFFFTEFYPYGRSLIYRRPISYIPLHFVKVKVLLFINAGADNSVRLKAGADAVEYESLVYKLLFTEFFIVIIRLAGYYNR